MRRLQLCVSGLQPNPSNFGKPASRHSLQISLTLTQISLKPEEKGFLYYSAFCSFIYKMSMEYPFEIDEPLPLCLYAYNPNTCVSPSIPDRCRLTPAVCPPQCPRTDLVFDPPPTPRISGF
jgi:hypothetical protein